MLRSFHAEGQDITKLQDIFLSPEMHGGLYFRDSFDQAR